MALRIARDSLDRIGKLTALSNPYFRDEPFRDYFVKSVSSDVSSARRLIDSLERYALSRGAAVEGSATDAVVDEVHASRVDEFSAKNLRILTEFGLGITRVDVPDSALRYMVGTVLRFCAAMADMGSQMHLTVRHEIPQNAGQHWQPGRVDAFVVAVSFSGSVEGLGRFEASKREELSVDDQAYRAEFALLRELVRLHRGDLSFSSSPRGDGAVVTLSLPMSKA